MGGLFGGNKSQPTVQPTTLPAPAAQTPQEKESQSAASADALRRAQSGASASGTLAMGDQSQTGDYSKTTLG